MSDQEPTNVSQISDYIGQAKLKNLYNQHDQTPNVTSEIEGKGNYSNHALSLLDDVEYFLTHPEYRKQFEEVLQQHLKDFSMEIIKDL